MIYLNTDRIYVPGAYCAAIYDLKNNVVYEINHVGRLILDRLPLDESLNLSNDEMDYINQLLDMDILTHDYKENTSYVFEQVPLLYVWLELTGFCNLRCVHCYGEFGETHTNTNVLTTEQWKRIIKEISLHPTAGIQFIGGEPLAYPDFDELLLYAYDCGIRRIDIFTNATLLTEKTLQIIRHTGASLRVSIYGHEADIHDKITGRKGSFNKLISNVNKAISLGIPLKFAFVVMKENENYVEACLDFLRKNYSKNQAYDVIRNTSPGKKNSHYIHSNKVSLLESRYQTKPSFKTSFREFYHNHYFNSCWSGKLSITAEGDVIPCIFARQSVCGNVGNISLSEAIDLLDKEWRITKDQVEICKDCEFRYACHDCRPTAYGITGNYYSKHARCTYDPYTGKWNGLEKYTQEINVEKGE